MGNLRFLLLSSIFIALVAILSGQSTAHTSQLDVKARIAILLPVGQESNTELLDKIGGEVFVTNSVAELANLTSQENPNAIVIHKDVMDEIDQGWLRSRYDEGMVLGGINMSRTELKQVLGLPFTEAEVIPSSVKTPYMSYIYERGNKEEGWHESGIGLAFLEKSNEFGEFVEEVERVSNTNKYHREQVEAKP